MSAPIGNKFAEGNDGGRPTKFKAIYAKRLVKFFDIEPFIKELSEFSKEYYKDGGLKKESEKFRFTPNKMPTLYRFSKSIKVNYSTVWRWAEKGEWTDEGDASDEFKEFCNAYKEAKELQKEFLINLGLAGAAPSPFAIFTAKNVTDMRDKTEVDNNINGILGVTLSDNQCEQLIRARANRGDTKGDSN